MKEKIKRSKSQREAESIPAAMFWDQSPRTACDPGTKLLTAGGHRGTSHLPIRSSPRKEPPPHPAASPRIFISISLHNRAFHPEQVAMRRCSSQTNGEQFKGWGTCSTVPYCFQFHTHSCTHPHTHTQRQTDTHPHTRGHPDRSAVGQFHLLCLLFPISCF